MSWLLPVISRASRALSIPVALSAPGFASKEPSAESMPPPRGFFSALGFLPLGLEGREASSSRSRASFSAFLRAASAAFSAAASLRYVSYCVSRGEDAHTPLHLTLRPCSIPLPLPSQLVGSLQPASMQRRLPCGLVLVPSSSPLHRRRPRPFSPLCCEVCEIVFVSEVDGRGARVF